MEQIMTLSIDRLTKQFGAKIALDRFSLDIKTGVYGLLGANGAGKTTFMRLICGILNPTSGEIKLDGVDTYSMGEQYRSMLGYLPQDFGYYPDFTALDYLLYIASLKGLSDSDAKFKTAELLELVSLTEVQNKKIKTFSGGMKQRLGIAQAMLNDPKILILDEPTAGLDPKERVRFRNLISSFAKNKIVILSTHIVSDVEYIADEILLVKDGQLLSQGTVDELIQSIKGCVWECVVPNDEVEGYVKTHCVANLKSEGDQTILRIVQKEKPIQTATNTAETLEDLYLFYFGGKTE